MLPMPPQTRREARRRSGRTACTFWIPLVTLGALVLSLLLAGDAAAQTTAPPPALEAGDTAPPPGAPPAEAPIAPLAPLPPPAVAAPASAPVSTTTAPLVLPAPPAPKHTPIYRKPWFWGAVGVVAVTGMILLAVALAHTDPSTPSTRLGDMRAF
jgi:hypothetical protein